MQGCLARHDDLRSFKRQGSNKRIGLDMFVDMFGYPGRHVSIEHEPSLRILGPPLSKIVSTADPLGLL